MKTWLVAGLAVVLVAIQFIRPARNASLASPFASPRDITIVFPPPPEVKQVLATACYDCHSNLTRYPWYANLQPAGWWLASHVNDAKKELNFSEFAGYSSKRQARRLESIVDEVRDRTMPLKSYKLIHADARLTEAQIKALSDWAEKAADELGE